MTSRSTSDYGNPAGIVLLMPKGTTWKGMGANRYFVKWLSYSRGITGTFGYCLVFGRSPWISRKIS